MLTFGSDGRFGAPAASQIPRFHRASPTGRLRHRMCPTPPARRNAEALPSKKPKFSSARRNAPSRFWGLAVWHENYSRLPLQVFSAGPD